MACQRSKLRRAPCCAPEIRANESVCSVGDWECPREQSSIKCAPRSCAPFRPSTDCPTMRLRGQLQSRLLIVVRPIMSGSFNSIWSAHAFCRDLGHGMSRSEERRVGKEGVSTCSSRWSPDHTQKNSSTTYAKTLHHNIRGHCET